MIQSGAISRRPSGLPPNFDPSPRNSLFMVAAESKTDRKAHDHELLISYEPFIMAHMIWKL